MPRKQPFSGKQKRKQLQERRNRKQDSHDDDDEEDTGSHKSARGKEKDDRSRSRVEVDRLNQQPVADKEWNPNRFRLHFFKISPEEMKVRQKEARKPIVKVKEEALEVSFEQIHGSDEALDFPKRPMWNYSMSKEKLEQQEQTYFKDYLQKIFSSHSLDELSYFELNLETWRQLWRVTEISDILLLITDIRFPVLQFPPSLYYYMRDTLKRDMILVLNKVDLAPPSLVAAWRAYITHLFPDLHIVCFTSFPKKPQEAQIGFHRKAKKTSAKPLGPQELLDVCKTIAGDKVDFSAWQRKLDTGDSSTSAPDREHGPDTSEDSSGQGDTYASETFRPEVYRKFHNGILTIGCIGYPNVGKSSLMNGLVGKKVVSVSRTPGHTKHLQTIFLTPTVRLCDCPGLVFPSYVDKALQILSGIYPIAQVRDPYSAVGYLAQRLDLPKLLHLSHPDQEQSHRPSEPQQELPWSALDICEAWAIKSGFFTAKASRPDTYRAGNQLLRMAVEGRLRLCLAPPHYFQKQDEWKNDLLATNLAKHLEKQVQQITSDGSEEDASESEESNKEGATTDSEEEKEGESTACVSSNPFELLANE
ncbi:guanine nucleotide-binding protein-like 1 isoform X1 [Pomacea canaliculata]|uniref:guanine nucleotide-binding protein-like 1 isoform X1 n=1 Tax=Pomacea canaliculata TaxID=400727 RepID=UPI000D7332CD|nr:guanine nucleotide-binding protein-like 1 isoform X1 [Pomacea canaliculata]